MRALLVFGWIMISAFSSAHAEETGEVKKIQDNSFLIEEAYNQEPGVIQHIQTFQYMKNATWGYSFVQEWPVPGRTHQLSYTIPVFHLDTDTNGKKTGIGDVMLNYRYQLIYKEKEGIALAPPRGWPAPDHLFRNFDTNGDSLLVLLWKWPEGPSARNSENQALCSISSWGIRSSHLPLSTWFSPGNLLSPRGHKR